MKPKGTRTIQTTKRLRVTSEVIGHVLLTLKLKPLKNVNLLSYMQMGKSGYVNPMSLQLQTPFRPMVV